MNISEVKASPPVGGHAGRPHADGNTIEHAAQSSALVTRNSPRQVAILYDIAELVIPYLPGSDLADTATALKWRVDNALRHLPSSHRIEYLPRRFGRQEDLLVRALGLADPELEDLVKDFTEDVMHDWGVETEVVPDLLQAAGLEHPRVFLFFAVLSTLSRLQKYPQTLAAERVDYLANRLSAITTRSAPATNAGLYEPQQRVNGYVALKKTGNNLFLDIFKSTIKNMPEFSGAMQDKVLALIRLSRNILDAEVWGELAASMPKLKANAQMGAYELFMDMVCPPYRIAGWQELVISYFVIFPKLNYDTQKLALNQFQHLSLHTPKIVTEFVKIMPDVHADLRGYADKSLLAVLTSRVTQRETACVIGTYLIGRLSNCGVQKQQEILSLILDIAALQTPEVLIELVKKLPYLDTARWQRGEDIQGKLYTALKRVLHGDKFKSFPVNEQLQVIAEIANVYNALSSARRAPRLRANQLRVLAVAAIPVPALTAVIGAVLAVVGGTRSVRKAVGDQILQIMKDLQMHYPLHEWSQKDMLIAMAPAWAELASKVYPHLSDKRRRQYRESIAQLCGKWIKTVTDEADHAEEKELLEETALVWEAVLTHVYPGFSDEMKNRVKTEIVDRYRALVDNEQQSALIDRAKRVVDALDSVVPGTAP